MFAVSSRLPSNYLPWLRPIFITMQCLHYAGSKAAARAGHCPIYQAHRPVRPASAGAWLQLAPCSPAQGGISPTNTALQWKPRKIKSKGSNSQRCCCAAWVCTHLRTSDVVLESRGCGTHWEVRVGRSSSVCATEMWWCNDACRGTETVTFLVWLATGRERARPGLPEAGALRVLGSQGTYEPVTFKLLSNPNVIPHNSIS